MLGMPGWRVGSHVQLTTLVSENATTVCLITAASPCTYIIYRSTGRGGQRGVGLGGGEAELREAHVQLRLAMWRDKYGGTRGAHATAGSDDYMLRRPYDTLIDSGKTPPLLCIYEAKRNMDATGTRQRV